MKSNKELPATPDGFTKNNEAGFCCYRFFDVVNRCDGKAIKTFSFGAATVGLCKSCFDKQMAKSKTKKVSKNKESVK